MGVRQCPVCGEAHAACGNYGLKYKPVGWEGDFKPAEVEEMPMVTIPERKRGGEVFESDERLYLDGEGKVVKADDPNRKSLLVGKGGTIPLARARELGLAGEDGAAPESAEPSTPETRGDAQPTSEDGAAEASTPMSRKAGAKKAVSKKK